MLKITKKQTKKEIIISVENFKFFLPQMILNYYRFNLLNNFCNMLLLILIRLELHSVIIEQHTKEILCYINNRRVTEFSVR